MRPCYCKYNLHLDHHRNRNRSRNRETTRSDAVTALVSNDAAVVVPCVVKIFKIYKYYIIIFSFM